MKNSGLFCEDALGRNKWGMDMKGHLANHGRAFIVVGPAVWNSLSDNLRDPALGTDSLRRLLKTRLFLEY